MNPLRIRLRNVRTFEELELEIPLGLTVVAGENGVGKSTLANVVDWALFGPDGRSWSPMLTLGIESTEMGLELTFEHGKTVYRIRRGFSARGAGKATLDFEQRQIRPVDIGEGLEPFADWLPLTRETVKATQELVEQTLGLTRQTFRASAMVVQGDGAAFTEAQPKDRKAILAEILGLDVWDRLAALVRPDIATAEREQETRRMRREELEVALEERRDVERSLKVSDDILADVTKVEKKLSSDYEKTDGWLRETATAGAARAAAAAQHAQIGVELRAQNETLERIVAAQKALTDGERTLETTSRGPAAELEEAIEQIRKEQRRWSERDAFAERSNAGRASAVQARDGLVEALEASDLQVARLREIVDELQTGDVCTTCGQPLAGDARDRAVQTAELDVAKQVAHSRELHEQAAAIVVGGEMERPAKDPELEPRAERLIVELAAARAIQTERAMLEGRLVELRATIAGAPAAEDVVELAVRFRRAKEALEAFPEPASDDEVERKRAELLTIRARQEEERIRWQVATVDRTRAQERLAILLQQAGELEDLIPTISAKEVELDRLHVLARAYGRDGVAAMIVQNAALPSIEREANRILGELGSSYRLELRAERALLSGDVTEALDVVVQTDDGERPYETFSGGERTRLNLALRIGLARLLAHRRGAESRLLVIDEPEYLDEAGTQALVGVLRSLAGDFDRILLISHVPALRSAAVDQTLEIVKSDDGRSYLSDDLRLRN